MHFIPSTRIIYNHLTLHEKTAIAKSVESSMKIFLQIRNIYGSLVIPLEEHWTSFFLEMSTGYDVIFFNYNAVFWPLFTTFEKKICLPIFLLCSSGKTLQLFYKHINCECKVWLYINLMLSLGAFTCHCMYYSFIMRFLVHYYASQVMILGITVLFIAFVQCCGVTLVFDPHSSVGRQHSWRLFVCSNFFLPN